jgi:hypothetical protein
VGVSKDRVPGPGELTAHVRTAADASRRWIARSLAVAEGDATGWEHSQFFARTTLMRGVERGELLGWVLQRDGLAETAGERATALRQAAAYWAEARPDLHAALEGLQRAADLSLADPAARSALQEARDQLDQARGWLTDLAEGLALTDRVAEVELGRRPLVPEQEYARDYL